MSKEKPVEIISELAGAAVDTGFNALALAAGFPAVAIAAPLAKGLIVGLIRNCYNDCAQRTLSVRESEKLNRMSTIALRTFRELAERDNVYAWKMSIDPAYIDYAYEVAEHATLEGIKQSERAKVDIIGRYYGRQLYKGVHRLARYASNHHNDRFVDFEADCDDKVDSGGIPGNR